MSTAEYGLFDRWQSLRIQGPVPLSVLSLHYIARGFTQRGNLDWCLAMLRARALHFNLEWVGDVSVSRQGDRVRFSTPATKTRGCNLCGSPSGVTRGLNPNGLRDTAVAAESRFLFFTFSSLAYMLHGVAAVHASEGGHDREFDHRWCTPTVRNSLEIVRTQIWQEPAKRDYTAEEAMETFEEYFVKTSKTRSSEVHVLTADIPKRCPRCDTDWEYTTHFPFRYPWGKTAWGGAGEAPQSKPAPDTNSPFYEAPSQVSAHDLLLDLDPRRKGTAKVDIKAGWGTIPQGARFVVTKPSGYFMEVLWQHRRRKVHSYSVELDELPEDPPHAEPAP